MIVACVPGVAGNFFHLSAITNHAHSRTPRPLPLLFPLPLVLVRCSLYSDHVRPGPCHWPSKERLITGKRRILFAFALAVSQFSRFSPSLRAVTIGPGSLFPFCLSHALPFFSPPCLYFLLCRVKSENTELRVLHPQIPACSLWAGY